MIKRYVLIILSIIVIFLSFNSLLYSEPVDFPTAEITAHNWLFQQNQNKGIERDLVLRSVEHFRFEGYEIFYIINYYPEGWVIIPADDSAFPIVAYNIKGHITFSGLGENARGFLDMHINSILEIIKRKMSNNATIELWNRIAENRMEAKGTKAVDPLLTTKWDQGYPWNTFCPEDPAGPGGHVYAGCVAVAMAQLMKYYNYPEHGYGSHSYNHPTYGELSADFGNTYYDWGGMADLDATDPARLLLFHSGVSVNMNYGPNGSGASSFDALNSFIQYFAYNPQLTFAVKQFYTDNAWIELLKSQLDNNYPLVYRGEGASGIGHAFICDGYDQNDLFHFNWGWSGYGDGYYHVNSLNPGGYDFSINQAIGIDVFPATGPDASIDGGDITFSPQNPLPGDSVTITARIYNMGSSAVSSGNADFYYSHAEDSGLYLIDTQSFSSIEPGNYHEISILWHTTVDMEPASYIITVILSGIAPYDINAGNNIAQFELPLPVELIYFSALGMVNRVNINWMTASETDNLGFNIYRVRTEKINQVLGFLPVKLNSSLIHGQGTSSSASAYFYYDSVKAGGDYIYILESVSTSGCTENFRTRLHWIL